jgi:hypothetical protein
MVSLRYSGSHLSPITQFLKKNWLASSKRGHASSLILGGVLLSNVQIMYAQLSFCLHHPFTIYTVIIQSFFFFAKSIKRLICYYKPTSQPTPLPPQKKKKERKNLTSQLLNEVHVISTQFGCHKPFLWSLGKKELGENSCTP